MVDQRVNGNGKKLQTPAKVELSPEGQNIDPNARKKAAKASKTQLELQRRYKPAIPRATLTRADQRTTLFKLSPSRVSTGEGADLTTTNVPRDDDDRKELSPAARMFRGLFSTADCSYDDLLPWRMRCSYRIVREMARLRGMTSDGDLLTELDAHGDPWMHPNLFQPKRIPKDIAQSFEAFHIFKESELLEQKWQVSAHDFSGGPKLNHMPGFALLPPPVPDCFLDGNGKVKEEYDPYEDKNLILFIECMESISQYLRIPPGSDYDPHVGTLGLKGMYDPEIIRLIFPTRTQLMMWEELLIEEAMEKVIEYGSRGAQQHLRLVHGMRDHEVAHILKAVKVLIVRRNEFDPDEERALMALRIEDYICRARNALDLKAEAFGLKQLSLIQGLGKTDPEDANNDMFTAIARKVHSLRPTVVESTALEA